MLWKSLLAKGGFRSTQSKDPNLVAGCYIKCLYDTMRELANACPAVLREDCIKNYCQVVFWQQCQNFMLKVGSNQTSRHRDLLLHEGAVCLEYDRT